MQGLRAAWWSQRVLFPHHGGGKFRQNDPNGMNILQVLWKHVKMQAIRILSHLVRWAAELLVLISREGPIMWSFHMRLIVYVVYRRVCALNCQDGHEGLGAWTDCTAVLQSILIWGKARIGVVARNLGQLLSGLCAAQLPDASRSTWWHEGVDLGGEDMGRCCLITSIRWVCERHGVQIQLVHQEVHLRQSVGRFAIAASVWGVLNFRSCIAFLVVFKCSLQIF